MKIDIMYEQLFFFKIKEEKPKEKPKPEKKQKRILKDYGLLYWLMEELYRLTIKRPLQGINYYQEDDTQYCEIIGTEEKTLKQRIKIYQWFIGQVKQKKYKENKQMKLFVNSELWGCSNEYSH